MQKVDISKYIEIIQDFACSATTRQVYCAKFRNIFQNEKRIFPHETYELLNNLFTDIDVCEEDQSIRESYQIGPEQLLENAKATLEILRRS